MKKPPLSEAYAAAELVEAGLWDTYQVHEDLGIEGVEAVEENQFGDQAMVADVQSERAMIDVLRASEQSFRVHSEEHGKLTVGDHLPSMLAVMDGLDGSSLYKKARGEGNYGSMFAIFESTDPRYNDYLAAGIMLHATAQLLVATRGQGVKQVDLRTGLARSAKTSDAALTHEALIYTDDDATVPKENVLYPYFQTNLKVLAEPLRKVGYTTSRTGASAGYYASLAMGEALAVGEATRKGNLELAAAYALVKEAGGSIVDVKTWQDIGDQKFTEYGQSSHEPFLAVANPAVLETMQQILGSNAGERAVK